MQNARSGPAAGAANLIPDNHAPMATPYSTYRVGIAMHSKETDMKYRHLALVTVVAGAVVGLLSPVGAQTHVSTNNPIVINGIDTVCTGVGHEAQNDPRWSTYPIRVEFSNGGAQYLSGAHVVLFAAGGKQLAELDCAGAWVLFKLAPGTYKIEATLLNNQGGGVHGATFSPPATGQKRVVLQFKLPPNQ